ncbi:PepSY domain-containing protein [Maritimibacter sp. 55A14]|uniref:PepSY domain-containing protein n=1 Tax=Maritimibacter sp. 55A14 TaxID=2174844 RepID=UPI000D614113|nr:PepSY domain-containing protein [Maritimibacter sp. 55A14]PWE34304.1 PepSY domain-containing protein [Maritimibacter sp. 55A14]
MTRTARIAAALAAAVTLTSPALASGTISAADRQTITEKLTAQGYEVRKIEMEDGEVEVYALKDGQRMELYLDENFDPRRIKADD